MKKFSIRIAIALTLVLSLSSALSGCSKKTEVKDTTNQSITDDPKAKIGKVSVMIYDRGTIPASEGTYDNNRWTKWIQENAPLQEVKFIIVPRSDAVQKMNMLFASGEGPDVLPNFEDNTPFVAKGQALALNDLIDKHMPNYKLILDKYPLLKNGTTTNGKIYTLGSIATTSYNHSLAIRADWLEKLNLSIPKTPEDLFAVAKAFTEKDPDGNGKNDTYGIGLNTDAQRVLAHMFGYGNPEKYKIENGQLSYAWDRMQDWLKYTKQFVDAKLVDPDFLLDKGDRSLADFTNGKLGIYMTGGFNKNDATIYKNFKKNNPNGKLDTFDLPATKYGSFVALTSSGASFAGFINSQAKDPIAAARYVNWLYDPSVSMYLKNGPDGVYQKKDSEGTFIPVDIEKNKIEFDYSSDYSIMNSNFLLDPGPNFNFNRLLKGSDPLAQEFGDLQFKMVQVANREKAIDPRKWQATLPPVPSDLVMSKESGNKAVDDILLKALATSSTTAEKAIADAKAAWKNAGGEAIDKFYSDYYSKNKDSMILPESFFDLKKMPEMTPTAKKNSKIK